MATSLQRRRIDVIFTLSAGTFDNTTGVDQITLKGLRVSAEIVSYGNNETGRAAVKIYGMLPRDMAKLTYRWYLGNIPINTIEIRAGNEGEQLKTAFIGNIFFAGVEYKGAPEVYLYVEAYQSTVAQLIPGEPKSWPGSIPVATIMKNLGEQLGVGFQNDGVTSSLVDMTLAGTVFDQIQKVQQAANINVLFEPPNLIIWPLGAYRSDAGIVQISPKSGLIGWPEMTSNGVDLTVLFNAELSRGKRIEIVDSIVPNTTGTFTVYGLTHHLESEVFGGTWQSTVNAAGQYGIYYPGQ